MGERRDEAALARFLKARTAARTPPEPPDALRDIAMRAKPRAAASRREAASAQDAAWAAALAACLILSVALGRGGVGLARSLNDPAIAGALRNAFSPSSLAALDAALRGGE